MTCLYWFFVCFFCVCVAITKISGRNNIKGERLILAYDFREFQPGKSGNRISIVCMETLHSLGDQKTDRVVETKGQVEPPEALSSHPHSTARPCLQKFTVFQNSFTNRPLCTLTGVLGYISAVSYTAPLSGRFFSASSLHECSTTLFLTGEAKEPRCPYSSLKLSYNLIFPNPGRREIHAKKKKLIPLFCCCSASSKENKKPVQATH